MSGKLKSLLSSREYHHRTGDISPAEVFESDIVKHSLLTS